MLGYIRHHAEKMSVLETYMFHWMYSNSKRDRVRNEDIFSMIGMVLIEGKIRENFL